MMAAANKKRKRQNHNDNPTVCKKSSSKETPSTTFGDTAPLKKTRYYTIKVREYVYKHYGHLEAKNYAKLRPDDDRVLQLIYVYKDPSILHRYVSFDQRSPHGSHDMLSNGNMDVFFHYSGSEDDAHLHQFQCIQGSRQDSALMKAKTGDFVMVRGGMCIMLLEADNSPREANENERRRWLPMLKSKIPDIAMEGKEEEDEKPDWGSRRASQYKPY